MLNPSFSKALVGLCLFLSLGLNLFFFSVMAGSGATRERPALEKLEKIGDLMSTLSDLSADSRKKVRATIKDTMPDIRAKLSALKEKRAEMKKVISSPDYKRADLEKIQTDIRAQVTELQKTTQKMSADIADAITPEERVRLINQLSEKYGNGG